MSNEPPPYPGDVPPYGTPPPVGGGYPPPPPGYPQGFDPYGRPPETNKNALWSMILGILSIPCCGVILGPVAIILSRNGKQEIAYSRGSQTGEGMATAGLVLGIIGIVVWVLSLIIRVGAYA